MLQNAAGTGGRQSFGRMVINRHLVARTASVRWLFGSVTRQQFSSRRSARFGIWRSKWEYSP
jgi:hypothetical protein